MKFLWQILKKSSALAVAAASRGSPSTVPPSLRSSVLIHKSSSITSQHQPFRAIHRFIMIHLFKKMVWASHTERDHYHAKAARKCRRHIPVPRKSAIVLADSPSPPECLHQDCAIGVIFVRGVSTPLS